jgi:hypothetical protein
MTDHGKTLFSFHDPRAPQRALFILGLALLACGAIFVLLIAVGAMPMRASDDLIAGVVFVSSFLLGGTFLTAYGLRDLLGSPAWHITPTHAFRTRGQRVIKELVLRDQPAPKTILMQRYGQTISVRVEFGRIAIVAPNQDVARAIAEAWQKSRS